MKKINKQKRKIFLFFICFITWLITYQPAMADTKEKLLEVTSLDIGYGGYAYELFDMEKNGDIELYFDENSFGDFSVKIYNNSNYEMVLNKDFLLSNTAVTYIIKNMKAGYYSIEIEPKDVSSIFNLTVNGTYIPDDEYPEFKISSTSETILKGKTKQLKIISDPVDIDYDVEWVSGNESVATVSENGLVKANGSGTTTITAYVESEDNNEYDYIYKCKITVISNDPSFSQIAKKMKEIGKTKYFTFKMVKKNKRAILYGGKDIAEHKGKTYGCIWVPQWYIELKKKGKDTLLSLKMESDVLLITMNKSSYLEFDKVVFGNKSSYVKYTYTSSDRFKEYYWGMKIRNVSTITLSSSINPNAKKLVKLKKVLKRKNCPIKVGSQKRGGYITGYVTKHGNKNFPKYIDYYKKLLKMYQ